MPSIINDFDEDEIIDSGGLLSTATVYMIRILTDNVMNGGGGYSYQDVANMTQDQIAHRLADMDFLKKPFHRTKRAGPGEVTTFARSDQDGFIHGRDSEGNLIKGRIAGRSRARQLMEEERLRKEQEKSRKEQRKKRRERRG